MRTHARTHCNALQRTHGQVRDELAAFDHLALDEFLTLADARSAAQPPLRALDASAARIVDTRSLTHALWTRSGVRPHAAPEQLLTTIAGLVKRDAEPGALPVDQPNDGAPALAHICIGRECAHRCHICPGTALTAATSAPGLGAAPSLVAQARTRLRARTWSTRRRARR
jgi:hypothetical protein